MNKQLHNIKKLKENMAHCTICPRKCLAKRFEGEIGACRQTDKIKIASYNLHFGEEPPISGAKGSGTIFLTSCSLACVFCQNYPISQLDNGKIYEPDEVVDIMIKLQKKGAHNINFVTPTHYSPLLAECVYNAREKGLNIPIVYNCSGYESEETIKLLDGIVDIYLVDAKYSNNELGRKYSNVSDYVEINKKAIKKMYEQVGHLVMKDEIAQKGIVVRHLMLPGNLANTKGVIDMLKEISTDMYVSLMGQYHPTHNAYDFDELSKGLTGYEYSEGVKYLKKSGFEQGWIQEI
ncbi:radical SAM protein [bacterium]